MGALKDFLSGVGEGIEQVISCLMVLSIILIIASFFVGGFIGYAIGENTVSQISYDKGYYAGKEKGKEEGKKEGKQEGLQEGIKIGGENGYLQGYEDKTYNKANVIETNEKAKLGEKRNEAKAQYLYFVALLAIPLILYWIPIIYLLNSYTGNISLDNFGDKSYRYAFITKILVTILSLIFAWIFLPSTFLANFSSSYFNSIPFETWNQIALVVTSSVFSFLVILLIETTICNSKNNQPLRFWSQIVWSIFFPIILYQFIGTLEAIYIVETELSIKMSLMQAGVSIFLFLFFTWKIYRAYFTHLPKKT